MSLFFERLFVPGSTDLPECRCGKEMKVALTERVPDQTDAHIRIYNCLACGHEMRLTLWAESWPGLPARQADPLPETATSETLALV
jgi:hypothetical protein